MRGRGRVLLLLLSLLALWLLSQIRVFTDISTVLVRPSWAHWLGTDSLGRDVAVRSIGGFSYTLVQTLVVFCSSVVLGGFCAVLSALYSRRWVDRVVVMLAETMRSFPAIVLGLLFSTAGMTLSVVLAAYFWIPVWRALRGEFLREQQLPYVLVAELAGRSRFSALCTEALPNCLPRLFPYGTVILGEILSSLSSLEFLGFGPPIQQPSLGGMLRESLHLGFVAPWVWLPGIVVFMGLLGLLSRFVRRHREELKWTPLA